MTDLTPPPADPDLPNFDAIAGQLVDRALVANDHAARTAVKDAESSALYKGFVRFILPATLEALYEECDLEETIRVGDAIAVNVVEQIAAGAAIRDLIAGHLIPSQPAATRLPAEFETTS